MNLVGTEYQITKDEVINNSEFSDSELVEVYGEAIDFYLKNASSKVYSIMYSAFRGIDKERQYAAIRYILNNDEDKIAGLRDAIIEYIRGAMYSGMDLNLYLQTGASHSVEVINILKKHGLWIVAKIEYTDEEIE
jgi:hypothetical protein